MTNYNDKHKIDFLVSNDVSLSQQLQTNKSNKFKKCSDCKKVRKPSDKNHQYCRHCYVYSKVPLSGNKVIDNFVKHTYIYNVKKSAWRMKFVPYDKFENVEFIAEGGFSKIYKATWIDGECQYVVLKKLNNSKNITSKELNELRISYDVSIGYKYDSTVVDKYISKYYGITQAPTTQEMMIIMPYYNSGDLIHYITKDFYNISWEKKLDSLSRIIVGLYRLHFENIIHRDFHSGNIFFGNDSARIGDLGLSKSATTESTDDNENYGIIPYMAPEIFKGQKYTAKSDIYSFGMIMWEVMTGRRPFWDRNHDTDLIIDIVDGLRPPIVTNAPEGYIELMKECWHPDPKKRPTAGSISDIYRRVRSKNKFEIMLKNEKKNPTKIIESSDIGPVIYNPGAIYKSRPLSGMINSAMTTRSLKTQSTGRPYYYLEDDANFTGKRKFLDNSNSTGGNNDNDEKVKRKKLTTNENNGYHTKEIEFDINMSVNQSCNNNEYKSKEIDFDV